MKQKLILLAGIRTIPPEIIEAARIDRVTGTRLVSTMILPLIWPVVVVVALIRLVDSVREDPDLISVLIIEKTPFVDGNLVLIFDRKTYALRQWIVTDGQGLKTSVAIYNLTTDKPQDARQFVISSAY